MTIQVKYLSDHQIEQEAHALLTAYHRQVEQIVIPPIPVDEILETHLGLSLDFDDLQEIVGVPDVLGALWADKREVYIDESLDPYLYPDMLGRYNFSVAHEIGHWCLHRHYLVNADSQNDMFTPAKPEPTVVCRTSQESERIEIQANRFAACLLMPRKMVLNHYDPARYQSLSRDEIYDYVIPGVAEKFAVSRSALRIRLESLGLLPEDSAVQQYEIVNY